jgi:hypothetical protein
MYVIDGYGEYDNYKKYIFFDLKENKTTKQNNNKTNKQQTNQ